MIKCGYPMWEAGFLLKLAFLVVSITVVDIFLSLMREEAVKCTTAGSAVTSGFCSMIFIFRKVHFVIMCCLHGRL